MRTIKFRAWDKELKEPIMYYNWTDLKEENLKGLILMQFTGLLDKNGKEIYEGDIIKWEGFKKWAWSEVVWDKEKAMFSPKQITFGLGVEVIGNIYEDPLLLKC